MERRGADQDEARQKNHTGQGQKSLPTIFADQHPQDRKPEDAQNRQRADERGLKQAALFVPPFRPRGGFERKRKPGLQVELFIDAEQRQLAEDLIYNRPDALPRYIAYFEEHAPQQDNNNTKVDPTEGMNVAERIHWQILHRRKEGIEPLITQVIEERTQEMNLPTSEAAVNVLNTILLPAMNSLGARFTERPAAAQSGEPRGATEVGTV